MITKGKVIPRIEELEYYFENYPEHPKEATIKADMCRLGQRFSPAAIKFYAGSHPRSHYIFSFDTSEEEEMGKEVSLGVPEDLRIKGGRYNLRPTVIQTRVALNSPYLIDVVDGRLMVCDNDPSKPIAEVEKREMSKYYTMKLKDGTPVWRICPELCWGYMCCITILHHCQFFDKGWQCKFCDMNANVTRQKSVRPIVAYKSVEAVREAVKIVFGTDEYCEAVISDGLRVMERRPHVIILEGGTIIRKITDLEDTDFYLQYVKAIKEEVGSRFELVIGLEAKSKEDNQKLKDAGVDVVLQDMEIWDEKLFPICCPGKAATKGSRDEWVRQMVEAVDVFGEGNVVTALVAGVEMAQPWGYKDVDAAVNSTTEGIDYLLSHGVHPELFVWCIEAGSALGGHPPIPLEYYVKLNLNYVRLWKKYRQPVPAYIQPIGAGNSVFHYSPYIDTYH